MSSGMPYEEASRAFAHRIGAIRCDYEMPYLLPHSVFARMLPQHDALRILFRDMLELYAERGVETEALSRSVSTKPRSTASSHGFSGTRSSPASRPRSCATVPDSITAASGSTPLIEAKTHRVGEGPQIPRQPRLRPHHIGGPYGVGGDNGQLLDRGPG